VLVIFYKEHKISVESIALLPYDMIEQEGRSVRYRKKLFPVYTPWVPVGSLRIYAADI
jgi:hypothetical protein